MIFKAFVSINSSSILYNLSRHFEVTLDDTRTDVLLLFCFLVDHLSKYLAIRLSLEAQKVDTGKISYYDSLSLSLQCIGISVYTCSHLNGMPIHCNDSSCTYSLFEGRLIHSNNSWYFIYTYTLLDGI